MKIALALITGISYLPDWVYGRERALKVILMFAITCAIIRSLPKDGTLEA